MSVSRETLPQSVSRETEERLLVFEALLRQWSARINLVSRADLPQIRRRHIDDSLQLARLLPQVPSGVDLGSGAGFPGLILAIATNLPFHLVEADHRKAAFLREAARETAAPVTIHACRIEALRLTSRLITARALAPLSNLLPLVEPLLQADTLCLFLKGATAEQEIDAARADWSFTLDRAASLHQHGVILQLRGIMRRGRSQSEP